MTTYSSLSAYPRWKAWLLVSIFSIALAEVSIGSSPFGLLHPVEVVVLGVVYGAQVLVLADDYGASIIVTATVYPFEELHRVGGVHVYRIGSSD